MNMTKETLSVLKTIRKNVDKEVMSNFVRKFTLILFTIGVVVPFNNCSYTDSSVFDADGGSQANEFGLSISISGGSFRVPQDVEIFTVGGSCDPGTYPENSIFWTLSTMNGQFVSESSGALFNSTCVNGNYSIQVQVPCPGLINTANNCYGLLESLKLTVSIYGANASGGLRPETRAISKAVTISP
jgi:hypothetical protein